MPPVPRILDVCPICGRTLQQVDTPGPDTTPYLCAEDRRGFWPSELTPASRALFNPIVRDYGVGDTAAMVMLHIEVDRDNAREQARVKPTPPPVPKPEPTPEPPTPPEPPRKASRKRKAD